PCGTNQACRFVRVIPRTLMLQGGREQRHHRLHDVACCSCGRRCHPSRSSTHCSTSRPGSSLNLVFSVAPVSRLRTHTVTSPFGLIRTRVCRQCCPKGPTTMPTKYAARIAASS